MNDTRIKDVRLFKATSTLSQPIADATHQISEISFVVLEIELQSGVIGQGYLLAFHYSPNAIIGALKDIVEQVKGFHTYETLKVREFLAQEHEYFGHEGLLQWASATINIAMWDAWGKTLGQPIHRILGQSQDKVPVYGSGGWLSYSDQELIEEVTDYKNRGFSAVKIKVGSKDIERDIERLKLVREAVGPKLNIMMDANQGMSLQDAISLSQQAKDIGIYWFEEPVNHNNYAGYETLRKKTQISISTGEREFSNQPLLELIRRDAVDLWQPDILRIGGVESWKESAALAQAYKIPVLPHYYKDYDVPLLCTIDNGAGAESFDWIDDIIDNKMKVDNGFAYPRQTPGWGFEFLHKFMTEV